MEKYLVLGLVFMVLLSGCIVDIALDEYHLKKAIDKEDPSLCEKIQSQNTTNYCYFSIAYAKKDPSICGSMKIDLEDPGPNNRDLCYMTIASAKGDPSICEEASNWSRNACYQQANFFTERGWVE